MSGLESKPPQRLHEPLAEIARLNELTESGFTDVEAVKEVLAIRREDLIHCVDRLAGVFRYYVGRSHAATELKKLCDATIKRCESAQEGITHYVSTCMDQYGERKLVGSQGGFFKRRAGGIQAMIFAQEFQPSRQYVNHIAPESACEYFAQKYLKKVSLTVFDVEAIRADLDQGLKVPGVHLAERGDYIKVE